MEKGAAERQEALLVSFGDPGAAAGLSLSWNAGGFLEATGAGSSWSVQSVWGKGHRQMPGSAPPHSEGFVEREPAAEVGWPGDRSPLSCRGVADFKGVSGHGFVFAESCGWSKFLF